MTRGCSVLIIAGLLGCGGCESCDRLPPADDAPLVVPAFRWVNDREHFWTTDASGESAPQLAYALEGVGFYLARRETPEFSIPIFRLQGAAGHVYVVDRTERASLLRSGYADEGVLGYVSPTSATDRLDLLAWRHPSGLRFLTTNPSEAPALEAAGYVSEGSVGFVPAKRPDADRSVRVGIYYFGMWSSAAFRSLNIDTNSDGRVDDGWPFRDRYFYGDARADDPWLGVRDLHDRIPIAAVERSSPYFDDLWRCGTSPCGPSSDPAPYAHLKPTIGYYDNSDPAVVEKHIQQAAENGISFFAFYWYWNNYNAVGTEDLNDGLTSFLHARNTRDLNFALYVCEHGGHLVIRTEAQARAAATAIARYIKKENYLRDADGRPVVFLCDTTGISRFGATGLSEAVPGGCKPRFAVVYRWQNGSEHFWTTDPNGESAPQLGYISEGIAFQVAVAATNEFSLPVYRLRCAPGHVYTTSVAERSARIEGGCVDEGVLGYVADRPRGDRAPLYAWRHPSGVRFLSVNEAEAAAIEAAGFAPEGVIAYVLAEPEPDWCLIDGFIDSIRAEAGEEITVTLSAGGGRYQEAAQRSLAGVGRIDAGNCIMPTDGGVGLDHVANDVGAWLSAQTARGLPLVPCFMQNWDTRPRLGVMIPRDAKVQPGVAREHTAYNFFTGLLNVHAWMNSQSGPLSGIVTLYAWNEWHEGGIIEPNAKDGALYLNLVNEAFRLPQGDHPCRTSGACPGP